MYQFITEVVHYRPRQPDRLLEDGDLLELGETQIQVIHTPGHTPGHLSFYFPVEKVLFLGDLDLVKAGPYYGDKASDIDDTIRSLKRLAGIDAEVYLCSHGKEGIYPGDPVHIYRYLSVIEQRDDRLLEFLASGPKGLKEITDQGIIYGGRTMAEGAWDLEHSEKIMMLKHLQRLENRKMVKEEDGLYHLV
jgi:glyoxylase-like metal-dependent hydrolase (beta-lactamase superfamily II)